MKYSTGINSRGRSIGGRFLSSGWLRPAHIAKLVATLFLYSPWAVYAAAPLRAQAHPALAGTPEKTLSPGTILAAGNARPRLWKEDPVAA